MRYADPSLCPDCRSDLPHAVPACPSCGLQVRHPLATELFSTLRRADVLLARLQQESRVPVAVGAPPAPPAVPPAPVPPPPLPQSAPARRTGVAWASVPKILLGLGAFFLLVAAVTFLAVSWSHLGVGGRTAVLLAFTALSGGAALLLHRLGLRIAGESLVVVGLGMLALDVVGAGNAGWFGELSDGAIALASGVALLVAGTAVGALRLAGRPRLVAPQLIAGLGLLVAYCGALETIGHPLLTSHLAVVLGVAGTLAARRAGLGVLAGSLAAPAGIAWAFGGLVALGEALDTPSVEQLWLDGSGWSLLATAAAAVVPGVVLRHRALIQWGGSVAALVVTAALAVPCIDTPVETVGLVALLITLGWTLALAFLPALLRPVAVAPAVIGGVILGGLVLVTTSIALGRWMEVVSSDRLRAAGRFTGTEPATEPLLTVPSALVVVAIAALLVSGTRDRARSTWIAWAAVAGVVAGVTAAVTVASYDVPVAAAIAVLLVTAAGAATVALALDDGAQLGVAALGMVVGGTAVVLGLPWSGLTVAASAVALVVAAALHLRAGVPALRAVGGSCLGPSLALLVWSATAAADLDTTWRGVPLLLALGVLAIARPRHEVEQPALLAGLLGGLLAINAAPDTASSLALHLTVLGFLVSATAVIHESRRHAAWAGGAILLLATWVRLGDLGVREPEAYTLPLAAILTVIGLIGLRRDPDASTATMLTPGLLLATLPSLLWVLDDPASLRAVLLGLGAVLMTVAGAALRWSAPLVVGAAVGATVVLRELGPYAGDAPAWVWIGLGGALLVVVGITWERRLLEIRTAAGLLGRLR
ncbi:hypothetical protein HNR19_002978 [Nocardioides thalensis]|uniref:DUF2157 domain-containing protein n=1 Tax=Nocardioides thalensis TaxID=1914755 RepID=A0A853C256_9ACTN|nr:hypothetical protein [Nocardioides thalensis]NYJ02280.1 hypothetical protein [Nocardioides thalensis]